MRKLCFLLIFLLLPFLIYAQNIPQATGWVNDFAGVISPEYKEKLNSLIEELEQKTTAEIAVVTVDSISPYGEIEYARLLFDNWKPGKKGKDNGVLVLVAIKERRWRIETGYGIEGILPDGLCGEIGRNYMVPYFKEGKYGEGLYQGVVKIAAAISGELRPGTIGRNFLLHKNKISNILIAFAPFLWLLIFYMPWKVFFALFILSCLGTIFLGFDPSYIGAVIAFTFFVSLLKFAIWLGIRRRRVGFHGSSWGGGYREGWGNGGFGGGGFGGGGGGFGGGGGGGGGAGGGF